MNVDPQQAKELFLQAVEKHAPGQWSTFLDQSCPDQPELRRRVELLLEAHLEAATAAHGKGDQGSPRPDNGSAAEHPGAHVGPYKLIEQIGEGGMGSVWMAQQTEPVKRLVALKLIRAGMDSRQVIARFEAERQALALMDHPNIARVFDGGATHASRPYFVMELVKGQPITKYCDERHLTPRQRLELFIPVCHAIQHAHQKGIIHRDLKPSNVLIALYDGQPVPKVIDFGVAKATGQSLTENTLVTGFGALVGTLEYMSPEQAEMNQLDIDTRSDIYSLGVLLYELLTGSPPFSRKELERASMLEMLRVIREREPSKPSTKLSSSDALPTLSANRGTEPAKLTKLVRGELDWIVMKALEKDRNRRYETANGFAEDVRRYLSDEPVQACPPSASYRFRKFARRNKQAAFAAMFIFLALVAGVVGTTWSLIREQQHSQQLQAAHERERQLNERARQAIETVTSHEAIDQLTRERELRPEQRDFLDKLILYYAESSREAGETEQERSRQAQAYSRIGIMNQVLGRSQDSENAYRRSAAIGRKLVADFPARPEFRHQLAGSLNNLGSLLHRLDNLREAESAKVEAVAVYRQLAAEFSDRPEYRQALSGVLNNLGNLFCETDRLPQAEQAHTEALAIRKQLAAGFPDRPILRRALAMSHNSLGWLFEKSQRLPEAEVAYAEALAAYKKLDVEAVFPNRPEFRMELATSQNNLGRVLRATNRPQEAEAAHAAALAILRQLVAEFPNRPEFREELADVERPKP